MQGPWDYVRELRDTNPGLFSVIYPAIAIAAAFAIFRTFADGGVGPTELVSFLFLGIFLFCVGYLVSLVLRHPRLKLLISLIIVIVGTIAYSTSIVKAYFATNAPSFQPMSTLCRLWSAFPYCPDAPDIEGLVTEGPRVAAFHWAPQGEQQVYVQFYGSIGRTSHIRPFMQALSDMGWNVQGIEGGGTRTDAASGVNEVRYYFDQDLANANRLVKAMKEAGIPAGAGSGLSLIKLSPDRYRQAEPGDLEIWISN